MVSIIVPIYKVERYIHECIDSILSQTYQDIEVILVDDGSPDKCGKICDEYAQKDSRVKVLHQNNGGVSLARYNGIMAAKGDWAFFVDADDYVLPEAIEKLISHSEGFDLISGTFAITDENLNHPKPYSKWVKEEGIFSGEEYVKGLLCLRRYPNICRMLIKMSILKEHSILIPPNIRIYEDFLFNVHLGLFLSRIKGISDVVYYYRMQEDSTVHTIKQSLKDADDVDAILENILNGKEEYKDALFKRRISEIKRFITEPKLLESSFVKKAIITSKNSRMSFSEKVSLNICKIKSTHLRKTLWYFFILLSKLKIWMSNKIHSNQ